MAKVIGALFSLRASGKFGKAITFVCGQFARRSMSSGGEKRGGTPEQMEKFALGAKMWKTLTKETKEIWETFYKEARLDSECVSITWDLSGYNMWMLYWLKFGENGWGDYPLP